MKRQGCLAATTKCHGEDTIWTNVALSLSLLGIIIPTLVEKFTDPNRKLLKQPSGGFFAIHPPLKMT